VFVHRPIVMSRRGLVVAGHHQAAEAGAQVLRDGGNAMDAAVATAATLAVSIPFMNGLGGDCFALWFDSKRGETVVINGSGSAPGKATIDHFRQNGHAAIPARGPLSVSVPGAVKAWGDCLQRFGTITLARALAPAIEAAEAGLAIDRVFCDYLNGPDYRTLAGQFAALGTVFRRPGSAVLGDSIAQPALAASFRKLAGGGTDEFYRGTLGQALVRDLAAAGGLLAMPDLEKHTTLFQKPLRVGYRGHEVLSAPPNTQGIALSLLLGLIERDTGGAATPDLSLTRWLALKQLAFAERDRHLGDPAHAPDLQPLLEAKAIDALLNADAAAGSRDKRRYAHAGGDTSTFVVVDGEGNAVSWVQSLFKDFGSGVVSESTGIVLQNRLSLATLDASHANGVAPGRRPFHTLCPALLLKDGRCTLAAATPGDHGQPQTIAQIIVNLLDKGMDVQQAIEAPRIRHDTARDVFYETRMTKQEVEALAQGGFEPKPVGPWSRLMGGANAIHCPDGKPMMGGADPRRASYAVAA
jgi:gamma-glutamyltranspeptidase